MLNPNILTNTLSLLMVQGNEVGIKYLKNQLLSDIKKPSIIAELNMVKFLIFSENQFYLSKSKANSLLMLVFISAVAKRNETREPCTVLRGVYRATKCLYRHAVLQERKLEGVYTIHYKKYFLKL